MLIISLPSHNQGPIAVATLGFRHGSCQAWVRFLSLVLISKVATALTIFEPQDPLCNTEVLMLTRLAVVRTAVPGAQKLVSSGAAIILSAQLKLEPSAPNPALSPRCFFSISGQLLVK